MGFIQDVIPAFTKQELTFVRREQETGDIQSFFFRPESHLHWEAGQHGIFFLDQKKGKASTRGFSIASSPEEGDLRVCTRITETPSEFKRIWSEMEPGHRIVMRGPVGPFHLDGSTRPIVLIGGGIGITPIRSLVLHALTLGAKAPKSIRILHADDREEFLFHEELELAAKANPILRYDRSTRQELASLVDSCIRESAPDTLYYLSGSRHLMFDLVHELRQFGVKSRSIRHEWFRGI